MSFTALAINTIARKGSLYAEGSGKGYTVYRSDRAMGRYVVGGVAPALILPVGTPVGVIRDRLRRMVERADDGTAETLGVWEDNGALYFDLGDTWTGVAMAIAVGQKRGELAIFDRDMGECITLP